jgi:hypothetical protein
VEGIERSGILHGVIVSSSDKESPMQMPPPDPDTLFEDLLQDLPAETTAMAREFKAFVRANWSYITTGQKTSQNHIPSLFVVDHIGFQGRGLDEVVQPDFCHGRFLKALIFQWS